MERDFIGPKFQLIDSNTDKLRKDMPDMSLNYRNTGKLKARPPITVTVDQNLYNIVKRKIHILNVDFSFKSITASTDFSAATKVLIIYFSIFVNNCL